MRIAVVQKCPSKVDYENILGIQGLEILNLCETKKSKVLVRDVTLDLDPNDYDWVILVGSEAMNMYSKIRAVSDHTGRKVIGKKGEKNLIAMINPSAMIFKPELKPVVQKTAEGIYNIIHDIDQADNIERDYQYFTEPDEFSQYLVEVLNMDDLKVVAVDTETDAFAPRDGEILGVSMSHKIHQGIYVHADAIDDHCVTLMQEVFDKYDIVLHNAKFDMHFLSFYFGLTFREGHVHDTMIMHYLLDERKGTHGLKALTMKYGSLGDYDTELDEWKKEYCRSHKVKITDFHYGLIPWDVIKVYAAKDTDATLELYYKFYPVLMGNERLFSCYNELMLPTLHFLFSMEDAGIPISSNRLKESKSVLEIMLVGLKEKLYGYPEVIELESINDGQKFNQNSPIQVRTLLFDVIGLTPTGKLTATGNICTDAEVMEELAQFHEIPKLIVQIKQTEKLKNTYIDKLLPSVDRDSMVRTSFNQCTTTSGRLSSSGKFNMQQLPRDNPIIKGCVKALPGYKIVAVDLGTAEIYYAAVLSKDINMQQVFINMKSDPKKYSDFHSTVAHMVFNLPCEPSEVSKKYKSFRQAAKAISFGILYGSGPAKVAATVNEELLKAGQEATCTVDDARGYIDDYFNKFPKLQSWIAECHRQIQNHGFIYNFFGRKRRLHNINSPDRGVAAGEVRSGFNAIIQSVSSDHLLLGAVEAKKEMDSKGIDGHIFALVHDSVVAMIREDQVPDYLEIIKSALQKDRGCSIKGVPVTVDEDSELGGSEDYSCGKLVKEFPELAMVA